MELEGILEGLLFIAGDEGISIKNACSILNIDVDTLKILMLQLQKNYESKNRGLRVNYLGETFKLVTKKEYKEYYAQFFGEGIDSKLSNAALEVLTIIAYKQPITRIQIDELRGISSVQIIRKLCSYGLVKICGKSELPGKPNLYGTTKEFLDYLGLATITDLPKLESEEVCDDETELFSSTYKET